ncbi:MAG TPA: lipid-A-disaccharide synthase [Candidatus Cloacimonadota bacterium]|nr:lipid-A-disaccharide synthase [Candidatus Cloacimonadota bacterium]HQL14876.1 lipid-A-disaccharide synthase [Candidatus Cloacimonadota bacterium]
MQPSKTIFWLAGESSGDLHASLVMHRLNQEIPFLRHIGIGGRRMQAEGLQPLFPFERFAVMGFVEVAMHLSFFLKVEKTIKKLFKTQKPDLAILVDYPGMNLRIARMADDEKIDVLYFIVPQFWAWQHKRVYQLRERTRQVACILPFEEELLKIHNINAAYVGHPIAEEVSFELDRNAFANFYGLDPAKQWLGFFPGSRNNEVNKLLPIYLQTISRMDADRYQFLFSKSLSVSHQLYQNLIDRYAQIRPFIIDGYNYEMMKYCDFLVLKSGTSTLEAAFIGTPGAIVYVANRISYEIGKRYIKVKMIGLPNLILEKKVFPELIQDEVKPERLQQVIQTYLSDGKLYEETKEELRRIHDILGSKVASVETVKIIRNMLQI